MQKSITIEGQEVAMRSSALLPIIYRQLFKADLFKDLATVGSGDNLTVENTEPLMRLAYAMAYHAGEKQPFEEWLSQFSLMGFVNSFGDIITLWQDEEATQSHAKKKSDQPSEK